MSLAWELLNSRRGWRCVCCPLPTFCECVAWKPWTRVEREPMLCEVGLLTDRFVMCWSLWCWYRCGDALCVSVVSYKPWYCLDARRVHRLMREERDCTILVLLVCFLWRIQARPMHLELPKQIVHNIRGRLVSCYKCHMVIAGRTFQLFEMGLGHATVLHVETLLHSFFSRFY